MEYSGEENLNVMKLAKNYNNYLVKLITQSINDSHVKKNVVDFGAGDGYFTSAVTKELKNQVISIEPADNMEKYYAQPPLKSLKEVSSGSVNFIYSLNVLEHIENDKDIINEFYRVLEPNGGILLYLPAFPCLYSSMDKLVGHYRRYTKKDVARLFDTALWKVEKVEYADFAGWFVSLLFKYIGNKSGEVSPKALKFYDKIIFPISLLLDKITKGKILGKNIIIKVKKH